MDSYESLVPKDPVELTIPFAHNLIMNRDFDEFAHSDRETSAIFEINLAMRQLDMIGDYDVTANLAFVVPEDTTPNEKGNVKLVRMDRRTEFCGELIGGRTLKIHKDIGDYSVRAVCLAFQDTLIKTRATESDGCATVFDMVEEENRLYVPVFAIDEIEQAA